MIKGSRLLLSLLLSMVIPMAVQAQTNHLQETLQAQKEKLEQLHMDAREHLNESLDRKERILLSRVDTNYIGLLPRSWRVSVRYGASHFRGRMITDDATVRLQTKLTSRVALGVGYRELNLSYNFGLNSKYNTEFNLGAFWNRMGIEIKIHGSDHLDVSSPASGSYAFLNTGEPAELLSILVDGYYAFNHRRFSYPAILSQSNIQKKSAGSILAAAGLSIMGFGLLEARDGLPSRWAESRFSLGCGYGYNWSIQEGRCLLHASAIPMVNLLDRGFTKIEGSSLEVTTSTRLSLISVVRLGFIYNWTDRLYMSLLMTNNPIFKNQSDRYILNNSFFGQISITVRI